MKHKKAFTLVELIVVISILGILSTIGFISYSGYLSGVRDTNRLSQLESFKNGLKKLSINKKLPLPDNKVLIKSDSDIIAYQGVIGKNVLSALEYSNDGLDPKDSIPYSYYITANKKYFQVMGFLESADSLSLKINNTYANTDYINRIPTVKGNKLGILTTENNVPLAEYLLSGSLSEINIANVNNLSLKSYLTNNEFITGTGTTFSELKNIAKIGGRYYSVVGNNFIYTEPN